MELGNKRCATSLAPTPDPPQHTPRPPPTHQALLLVLDGLGVVSHEDHGEDEVKDSKDGMQPKEVVAVERGEHPLPSRLGPQAGAGLG